MKVGITQLLPELKRYVDDGRQGNAHNWTPSSGALDIVIAECFKLVLYTRTFCDDGTIQTPSMSSDIAAHHMWLLSA